jgi:hypothetical protein
MKFWPVLLILISFRAFPDCEDEQIVSGKYLLSVTEKNDIYVQTENHFTRLSEMDYLDPLKNYTIQFWDYDFNINTQYHPENFIEYYNFQRLQDFMEESSEKFGRLNYKYQSIGKSLQGRKLYVLLPKKIDPNKKTVVIFARHHGDEGSSNWILEGFLNEFFNNPQNFNLVVYPMVNPDGAENRTRYNSQDKDLNRLWGMNEDETFQFQTHINSLNLNWNKIPIILDLHGSKNRDFIYRVDEDFINLNYYNIQGDFINTLASFDPWQKNNYIISNGDEGMARVFFATTKKINSITHETPKNISISSGRSIETLKNQGKSIYRAILQKYF